MPGVGDQHKDSSGATTNPFEEPERRMSEYTAQQIATLSSRLEKQLGPEYISTRPGASGQKVHYLAAEKCIQLANEVFGFNGWSSSIKSIQIDFVDENEDTKKVSLGLSVIMRVTLKDGTHHEDIGYGHIENCKGKAAAFEKAKKEGTTDALKRALRTFGNVLGNCIYDKDYLLRVARVKLAPTRWDPENLHRHSDYAPVKKEPDSDETVHNDTSHPSAMEVDDEFGEDFDEADFGEGNTTGNRPDEVSVNPTMTTGQSRGSGHPNGFKPGQPLTGVGFADMPQPKASAGTNNQPMQQPAQRNNRAPPQQQPHTPGPVPRHPSGIQPRPNMGPPHNASHPPQRPQQQAPPPIRNMAGTNQVGNKPNPPHPQQAAPAQRQEAQPPAVVGFYTAKVATIIQESESAPPPDAPTFNPHAESPSIRKTTGVDHTKSRPINREALGISTDSPSRPAVPRAGAFVNPQLDATRRIGMPTSPIPLQNRTSYKPPGPAVGVGTKRGLDNPTGQQQHQQPATRTPLNDMPTNTAATTTGTTIAAAAAPDGPGDAKRPKIGGPT
ncbi:MAG: DNA repair protein rad52 [Peltula sp. TS41687]|nr:MAG: DNA repair protein rad52 [Peltula sp. TS41687]